MRSICSFVLFVFISSFASCGSAPPPAQGSTFYYYPKPNVYYDIEQKEYYAFDSAKKGWKRGAKLTAAEAAGFGKKVVIDTPAVPVYKDNAHHRLVYSAALYTSPQAMREKYIEDSIRSLPPKRLAKDTAAIETPKKHKTKIGKWLDKIFH